MERAQEGERERERGTLLSSRVIITGRERSSRKELLALFLPPSRSRGPCTRMREQRLLLLRARASRGHALLPPPTASLSFFHVSSLLLPFFTSFFSSTDALRRVPRRAASPRASVCAYASRERARLCVSLITVIRRSCSGVSAANYNHRCPHVTSLFSRVPAAARFGAARSLSIVASV